MSDSNLPSIFKPGTRPEGALLTKNQLKEHKEYMQSIAADYAQEAIERLVYWMRDTTNPNVSLAATDKLLVLAFGKPKENIDTPEPGSQAVPNLNVQIVFVDHDGNKLPATDTRTTLITQTKE